MTHRIARRATVLVTFIVFIFVFGSNARADTDVVAPAVPHGTIGQRAHSLMGLCVFTILAWGIGRAMGARTRIPFRTLFWGLLLQFP